MPRLYRLPRLLWRLPLGSGKPRGRIVAHSYSMYELIVEGREGVEAIGVDVRRGLVWREPVEGGVYVGRGLRISGKSIVDATGATLVKLRVVPERVWYSRRALIAADARRARIVDKATLEEVGELDARRLRVVEDEYTLVAFGRGKRGYTLLVDSLYGFAVEKLKRNISSISVSRGCFAACDPIGCLVGNGSFVAATASNRVEPVAAFRGGCLVAVESERGRAVVAVTADGGMEVVDSCEGRPEAVYADGELIVYRCEGALRYLKAGSSIPEHRRVDSVAVATPSVVLSAEEIGGLHAYIMRGEDHEVIIPVEHYAAAYKDALMVLSGGWLYSIDFSAYTVIEVEEVEGCPLGVKLDVNDYKLLNVSVEAEDVELLREDYAPSGYRACFSPEKLEASYELNMRVDLAPPLIAELVYTAMPPKPGINVHIVEAPGASAIMLLGDNEMYVDEARALLVEVEEEWVKTLKGATLKVVSGGVTEAEARLEGRYALLPYALRGEPLIVLEKGGVRFEYRPGGRIRLEPPAGASARIVRMASPSLFTVRVEGVEADKLLVCGSPCSAEGGGWRCRIDPYEENCEICGCVVLSGGSSLCACRAARDIIRGIRGELAEITALSLEPVAVVDARNPSIRLQLSVADPGATVLEARVGGERVARTYRLGAAEEEVVLPLPRLEPGIYEAVLRAAGRSGVAEIEARLVYAEPPPAAVLATHAGIVVCVGADALVELENSAVPLAGGTCVKLGEQPRAIHLLDDCGHHLVVEPRLTRIEELVAYAARAAALARMAARL